MEDWNLLALVLIFLGCILILGGIIGLAKDAYKIFKGENIYDVEKIETTVAKLREDKINKILK